MRADLPPISTIMTASAGTDPGRGPLVSDMRFNPLSLLMRGMIQFYRWFISPLLGPRCRHLPSCSEYTMDAIERFGPWKGFWLGVSRLSRCHPWGTHGFDPVPDKLPEVPWYRPWDYGRWSWSAEPCGTKTRETK